MAVQGGLITPQFGGATGVSFMDKTPWDSIILAMDAGCLLFMLFGYPESIASIQYVKTIGD